MTLRRSVALVIAIIALLTTGTLAAADDRRPPRATMNLTIMGEVGTGRVANAKLTCDPSGGGHPKAAAACAELNEVGGDLNRMPDQQVMCTMEYAPVTAAARGHWRGKVVTWQREFSNRCVMNAATGSVFQF